jgi:hypothetical protein
MSQKIKVDVNSEGFDQFLNELLNELIEDVEEAGTNSQNYRDLVKQSKMGTEMYGNLYNDALKIKGSARDRIIKILAIMKDRVKAKEDKKDSKKENIEQENIADLTKQIIDQMEATKQKVKSKAKEENE